jgi:hypothetical protein
MEFYVFQTEQLANACINTLNAQPYYPVRGKVKGQLADDSKQKTERWALEPLEMLTGEWAVPRVPTATLDYVGAPEEDRQGFLAVHGTDIRTLTSDDFTAPVI